MAAPEAPTRLPVLSLSQCRDLLEGVSLADDEVLRLRDQLADVASVVLDTYASNKPSRFDKAKLLLTPAQQEVAEERAAIIEFDGCLRRDDAERSAIAAAVSVSGLSAIEQTPTIDALANSKAPQNRRTGRKVSAPRGGRLFKMRKER